ncbi:DUF1624 domain-containing protein [Mucilaginibacter sp. AW1-3]
MSTTTMGNVIAMPEQPAVVKGKRLESIDVLRGTVMIIMAIDHVRDYFHADAFLYSPTDLSRTTTTLFLTRFITHYCAPVFIFLAGVSAYLYGIKRSKRELSLFLFSRGVWLILAELFVVTLLQTFNPHYPFFNLQVIWATGICMVVLSVMIYLDQRLILALSLLLIAGHNLLDAVHVPGTGVPSFAWSVLHEPGDFRFGEFLFSVKYPVLPWIGVMALGYCLGSLYAPVYDAERRKNMLLFLGVIAIILFMLLRLSNVYGDAAHWAMQKTLPLGLLSFLNVTKYPPSFLYILITLGPALIFLSVAEKPLNLITARIAIFGRVPLFYYLLHFFLIHLMAIVGAGFLGYAWQDMILSVRINASAALKGYGFTLATVYLVWAILLIILYPLCKWFDSYKRANLAKHRWLSYL